ncbi:uncharacterized protein LOC126836812 [Adelges cooleyi]|uniref:uncharacterized protein LOC126836812 n=1 Tax=Adelges cooleyi TaxID=133065 RepID=UPI0021808DBA|nr:uncharacterized protein LOC126836812 [Adelges cooleyi]XP_050426428.1 uncharacterized protein LOC126836812 [Adelges cooleyi]
MNVKCAIILWIVMIVSCQPAKSMQSHSRETVRQKEMLRQVEIQNRLDPTDDATEQVIEDLWSFAEILVIDDQGIFEGIGFTNETKMKAILPVEYHELMRNWLIENRDLRRPEDPATLIYRTKFGKLMKFLMVPAERIEFLNELKNPKGETS